MKLTKQMYSDWCYWDSYEEAFEQDAIQLRRPKSHQWVWALWWRWFRFTQPIRFVWYHVRGRHKDECWMDPMGTIHCEDDRYK